MELRDLGGALSRQRVAALVVLVITVVAVCVGLVLAPKTYTASTAVAARVDPATDTGNDSPDSLRGTLGELANSRGVIDGVQQELGVQRSDAELRSAVQGQWVQGTILVEITATDRDPQVAADIANTVARVLPLNDPSRAFLFTISDPAEPPATYSSPDRLLALVVGGVVAVLLALGTAVLLDRRRPPVEDGAVVETAADAPLLAHLPPPRDTATLPALYPGTQSAEAFRHLGLALDSLHAARPLGVVVVAGVRAGDVPVWLGANLAIAQALAGRRVLLVDARLGEGPVEVDGRPDTAGLGEVLLGAPLREATSAGPADGLFVVPPGSTGTEDPTRLLTDRFAEVAAQAQAEHDLVVVLAPALDRGDDAVLMALQGSLVLTVPEGQLRPAQLRGLSERVRAGGARLLGVVLVSRRAERVRV